MRNERTRNPLKIILGAALILSGLGILGMQQITYNSFHGSFTDDEYFESTLTQAEYADEANDYLKAEGIQTPLVLQTDERWSNESYGVDGGQSIAENGCAPASLAMVLAYHEKRSVSPSEITDWAQAKYYVAGSGTDWSIFSDFAQANNLTYHDLGADFTKAQPYLEKGNPVVVSALPGEFTDNGHIMVLANYQATEDHLTILDPNDDPEKSHTYTWYAASEYVDQFQHYWTFTKDTAL